MVIGEIWRRILFLIRRRQFDRDLADEMQFHLEMKSKAAGDPTAARRQFGNTTLLKEASHEMWGWNSLETLIQDVRYSLRTMRRSPGFTTIVIATLALGIGANTAIFSVVNGVLLSPLPFPAQDRLVSVYSHFLPPDVKHGAFSVADFLDLKAKNRCFQEFAAVTGNRVTLTGIERPDVITIATVTSSFFSILGARPLLGRTFLEGEDQPTSPRLAILTQRLWLRQFSGDLGVVGRGVILNGANYTIVGVMPEDFQFPQRDVELWTIMRLTPPQYRFPFFLRGIARLKPGVTLEQAQADLNSLAPGIEQSDPKTYSRLSFPVVPLREGMVGNVRLALLVMLGAVGLVLLIASVNVANLLLARAASREREIAIRMSIGASRFRLLRQLLTESILLAMSGGLGGVLLAAWGVRWLKTLSVVNIPRLNEAHIDGRVLGFTLLVALVSGIAFGLAPALESIRFRMNESLKQNERSGTESRSRRTTRSVLVVAEVALSFLLLMGAGLLLRSFTKLQAVNPGFRTDDLLVARISPVGPKYQDGAKRAAFFDEVLHSMHALPGVKSFALTGSLPPNNPGWMEGYRIEGRPPEDARANGSVPLTVVTPDYFRTLGVPLLKGRMFTEHDSLSAPPVVIISETMARKQFANQNPIGKRLMFGWSLPDQPWREIVGVVGDVSYRGLDAEPLAAYYSPLSQNPYTGVYLIVRAPGPLRLADAVRASVRTIDKDVPVSEVSTMEQVLSESVSQPRFRTTLLAVFAGVALVLAAIGIYGVVAYSVTQRVHEFGIRMALGAQPADVLKLVVRWSTLLLLSGVAAGALGSLALTKVLRNLLYHVTPQDPITFAVVTGVLTGASLLATIIPARRAIRIDPLTALREE